MYWRECIVLLSILTMRNSPQWRATRASVHTMTQGNSDNERSRAREQRISKAQLTAVSWDAPGVLTSGCQYNNIIAQVAGANTVYFVTTPS